VLLAQMNKTQPSTPSNCKIRYQHCSDEKLQGDDASSKTPTAMEGEKIIFGKLTPVAESSNESMPPPPVVASPALQHPPVVELPGTQQLPCIQLNTQPPSVENSPTQQGVALLVSTSASDDLVEDEDDMATTSCAAHQLCCDPNSDTDNYCFCMNCNGEAHTICIKQINFQTPASDKLVITHRDFCLMGKERYKKTPKSHHQNVVFCLLCKAQMIQKKLHPTKKLGAPRKTKKGKFGPSAGLLRNLRKVATYHCQTIIFTIVDKTSDKAKHAAIEEAFMAMLVRM